MLAAVNVAAVCCPVTLELYISVASVAIEPYLFLRLSLLLL